MRIGVSAVVAGLCGLAVGLGTGPVALGKVKPLHCRRGTVQVRVGAKAACVSRKLVLPGPDNTNSIVAQVQGALVFAQLSFKAHSGKRVKSYSHQLGRSWATARGRLRRRCRE